MTKIYKILIVIRYAYYILCPKKIKSQNYDDEIIITLTSYGKRLKWLSITLASLLIQIKTRKIILFIGESEILPNHLKKFINKNKEKIQVYNVRDTRSYKKLLPIINPEEVKNEGSKAQLLKIVNDRNTKGFITVDDDIIYLRGSIDKLAQIRENIVCSIAHEKTKILKYKKWGSLKEGLYESKRALAVGAGGVYYPKKFIEAVRDRKIYEDFEKYCPNQDDLWWNLLAVQEKYMVEVVSAEIIKLDNIFNMEKLSVENLLNKNDYAITEISKKWIDYI